MIGQADGQQNMGDGHREKKHEECTARGEEGYFKISSPLEAIIISTHRFRYLIPLLRNLKAYISNNPHMHRDPCGQPQQESKTLSAPCVTFSLPFLTILL